MTSTIRTYTAAGESVVPQEVTQLVDGDITVTGTVDGVDISAHSANADAHHAEAHTVASHSDTTATGAELDTVTDGSNADARHVHTAPYVTAPTATKTTSYTGTAADGVVLMDATSGASTYIPVDPSTVTGQAFVCKKIDSSGNTVTVNPAGANTIDGSLTHVLSAQYDAVGFVSDGSVYWIIGSHP